MAIHLINFCGNRKKILSILIGISIFQPTEIVKILFSFLNIQIFHYDTKDRNNNDAEKYTKKDIFHITDLRYKRIMIYYYVLYKLINKIMMFNANIFFQKYFKQ